ncbi:MAG: MFS transporter [Chloroflexi bacterium]|nr:MAG: MFS transporter [Chloroflexota bacterium]
MKLHVFTHLRPSFSPARLAVTVVFFINGFVFSNWVPRIPAIQQHLGLNTGMLGLALWGIAIGALLSQSLAGWLVTRLSSRMVMRVASLLYCMALPLPALAMDLPTLMLALFALGLTNGLLDVAMNAQGVVVEQGEGHPVFSSFHAAFSGGGLLGAVCGGLLASFGVAPLFHFCLVAVVTMSAALGAARWLLPGRTDVKRGRGRAIFRPSRLLLLLGFMAFCALLGEGTVADWSAVYLQGTLHTSVGLAAGGFAAFSLMMAFGRLIGDHLTGVWGPAVLAQRSGLLAAGGLGMALLIPHPVVAIVGYAFFGAGLSCIFPIVLRAAGHLENIQVAAAIAAVSTVGYTGFLAGPPMIGFLAEWLTLRGALGVVVMLTFLIAVLAGSIQQRNFERRRYTGEKRGALKKPMRF